jgi:hypothetical protein
MLNIFKFSSLNLFFLLLLNPLLFSQKITRDAEYSSEIVLEVDKKGNGTTYIEKGKYVILNEGGLKFCNLSFKYGFNSKILEISAIIRSYDGKVIKKLKKANIKDYSAQSSGSLYNDTRYKTFFLSCEKYPFILEYEIKKKYDEALVYPSFLPKIDYKLINLESSFKVILPDAKKINFFERNIEKANTYQDGNNIIYEWKTDSLPPIVNEPFSYPEYWDMPKVLLAPENFNLEYEGGNNSWIEFGDWIYKLNESRGKLTEKEINTIDSLLLNTTDEFKIIDILYNYLKNNTRYVSIQDGIGGWQPFMASFVCKKKYGDCKALTNYMQALLKHSGIQSYYSLIKAGINTSDIISEFPSNQFNHAILMIPVASDTIWLDCTSKITPTGFVEKFIADRYALVIDQNKSNLVKTPTYDTVQNAEHIKGILKLNSDLTGNGKITFRKYAHRSLSSRSLNKYNNSSTREKYMKKEIALPSFSITSEDHREKVENFIPVIIDSIDFKINIAGKKAGSKIFLSYPLNMNVNDIEHEKRKTDIYISDSYSRTDSLLILLPDEYELATPTNFNFNSDFGNLNYSVQSDGNTILFIVRYSLIKGRYTKERIHDFKKFIEHINKIESYEIILSQKGEN